MNQGFRELLVACCAAFWCCCGASAYAAQVIARVFVTPQADVAEVRNALIGQGAVVKDFLPEDAFAVVVDELKLGDLSLVPGVLRVDVIAAPSTGGIPFGPPTERREAPGFNVLPADEERQRDSQAGVTPVIEVVPSTLGLRRAAAVNATARPTTIGNSLSAVDNSLSAYFPPIGDQEGRASCAAWAACYYWTTYTQAKDENKSASGSWLPRDPPCDILDANGKFDPVKFANCRPTIAPPRPSAGLEVIASPAFLYPLINHGQDGGTYFTMGQVMARLNDVGCGSWASKPYDPWQFNSVVYDWPTEGQWVEALTRRTRETRIIDLRSAGQLDALKQLLANGEIAITRGDVYQNWFAFYDPSCQSGGACPGISNDVLFSDGGTAFKGGHAVTVVGYDDEKAYIDSNGNTRRGALLIANSGGPLFGTFNSTGSTANPGPDRNSRGFIWIAYEYAMTSGNWDVMYFNVDRARYRPRLYAASGLSAANRLDLALRGGTGPTTAQPRYASQQTLRPDFNFSRVAQPIDPSKRVVVDLTDGIGTVDFTDSRKIPPLFVDLTGCAGVSGTCALENTDFFHDPDGDGVDVVKLPSPDPRKTLSATQTSLKACTAVASKDKGDVNDSRTVDRTDIGLITRAIGSPADCASDPRDVNGSGVISVIDARLAVTQCTKNGCQP